jgi:ABC-type nitrate/sulfonate/bicarbonate transport system ATPase subunit
MFDEPFNSLDDDIRKSLIVKVKKILHIRKTPAIFVTHRGDETQLLEAKELELRNVSAIISAAQYDQ